MINNPEHHKKLQLYIENKVFFIEAPGNVTYKKLSDKSFNLNNLVYY